MLSITYSKGIYTITDSVKTYTFNINNGHLINTKTEKRVCKPAFKKDDMCMALRSHWLNNECFDYTDMLTAFYRQLRDCSIMETFNSNIRLLTFLSALDKLFNVMPKGYVLTSPYVIENLSNKQLVKVINYVRNYNNATDKRINLNDIIKNMQIEELATTYGNLPIEFVTKYRDTLQQLYELGENYRDIALYYFYNQKLYALRTDKRANYCYFYGKEYILTYIECCKIMRKEPIKTNNFMREYIETIMAYDIWCETSKNERFTQQK